MSWPCKVSTCSRADRYSATARRTSMIPRAERSQPVGPLHWLMFRRGPSASLPTYRKPKALRSVVQQPPPTQIILSFWLGPKSNYDCASAHFDYQGVRHKLSPVERGGLWPANILQRNRLQ